MQVLTREGSLLDAPDRLRGRGRPLCSDYDGVMLAVGCEDGAVMTFGIRQVMTVGIRLVMIRDKVGGVVCPTVT